MFDHSSPVHPVSQSSGGGLTMTHKGQRTKYKGRTKNRQRTGEGRAKDGPRTEILVLILIHHHLVFKDSSFIIGS